MSTHHLPIRIYYEDTDFSGLVYHASYLRFFERGRTELLRDAGLHHKALMEAPDPRVFAVHKMEITFHQPARMDDLLTVETRLTALKGARLVMTQRLLRDQDIMVSATVHVAVMDTAGRPKRLDGDLFATLHDRLSP